MSENTILVVDDEFDILEVLAELLEGEGHRVITARNGKEALEVVAKEDVDLLVVDIMMPMLTGPEMVRTLQKEGRSIPVLMMSAARPDPEVEALADRFLAKPFDVDEFLTTTERMLPEDGP